MKTEDAVYLFDRLEQVFECALEAKDFGVCIVALQQQQNLLEAHPEISECDDTCEDCEAESVAPANATKASN